MTDLANDGKVNGNGPISGTLSGAIKGAASIAKSVGQVLSNAISSEEEEGKRAKSAPNPDGQHGKQDHKDKVAELAEKLDGERKGGEELLTGKKIQGIPGTNHRPDVQIVDKSGKTRKIAEAERKPTHKRNRLREEEYGQLGIENETHGVGEGAGKGKSDANQTDSSDHTSNDPFGGSG